MQFTYFQEKDDIREKEYYSLLGKNKEHIHSNFS